MIGLISIKWNVLKANFFVFWNTHCDISPFKAPNTCLKTFCKASLEYTRKNGVGFYTHGKQLDHSKLKMQLTTQWKNALKMPIGSQGIGVIEFIYKGGKVKVHLVFSQNRV